MNTVNTNDLLNDLFVALHRSLMQYVDDAWIWVKKSSGELQASLLSLTERQRQDCGKIAVVLMDRWHVIDFGVYPSDFSRMNYVALTFLFEPLLQNQQQIVEMLDNALVALSSDAKATEVVQGILDSQREGLDQLKSAISEFKKTLPKA